MPNQYIDTKVYVCQIIVNAQGLWNSYPQCTRRGLKAILLHKGNCKCLLHLMQIHLIVNHNLGMESQYFRVFPSGGSPMGCMSFLITVVSPTKSKNVQIFFQYLHGIS